MGRQRRLRISGDARGVNLIGDWEAAPLDGLCEAARLARALDKLQRHLVQQARVAGRSWAEIGNALGISKQSAWERFATPQD